VKVLHIYKDYDPVLGGIENHIKLLAEGQRARGLDVTVLVTNPPQAGPNYRRTGRVEINGVPVIRAGRLATVASTPISLDLFRWARRLPADVVHLHFPYPLGEVANLLAGPRPTVITYHSDVVRQQGLLRLYRPLLRRVLQRADRIIATSPVYIETSPYLRPLAYKCQVIPLGLDVNRFAQADPEKVAAIRARSGTPLLLFVGRLRYYKGLQYLIQAMTQIEARLLVVGSGPMEAEWQQLTGRLGLQDKVIFVGEVPDADLPAYYHAADLFVLPACQRSEAFGGVLLEAMAAGRPVISTELGTGTSYVNTQGETGLVVPPADPQELVLAILQLLGDPEMRHCMGQAGQARVRATYDHNQVIDQVIAVYQAVLL